MGMLLASQPVLEVGTLRFSVTVTQKVGLKNNSTRAL